MEYARQVLTFSSPAPGVFIWTNSAAAVFPTAATGWGTLAYGAIVDGATTGAGNEILHGALGAAVAVPAGYQVKLVAGAAQVTFP